MSPSAATPGSPVIPPPNAGFQDGGDFTLRSCSEEVEFRVFRLFLMTASPVFQDILTSGTGPPVMDLAEDAETISALLQYIYPRENPTITTYELFEKVLEAARKYELGFITSDLRASMRSDSAAFTYLRAEPLRMYGLAIRHGFEGEVLVAAKLTIGKHNFASREGARALLATNVPTSDAVMLMRMHMGRDTALNNLESDWRYFAGFPVKCKQCKDDGKPMSELQRVWIRETLGTLRKEPLDKAGRLFEQEFFQGLKQRCMCSDCREGGMYEQYLKGWADEIRVKLVALELDVL